MVTLWLSDLRHSLRTLRREPLSSFAIVLTLGLGLGVNAAVFSFVEAVLLRPLPAHEPERLVVLWESDLSPRRDLIEVSLPNFLDWRRDARELEEMAAMGTHDWGYVLLGEGEPARVPYRAVSASFFDTLRVAPLLGRTFLPEDDTPGAPRVIIISYGFWQTRLGGDEAAIGRRLLFEDFAEPELFTIVGVMPRSFQFPLGSEAWVPARRQLSAIADANGFDERTRRGLGVFVVVGRLAPESSFDVAKSELSGIVGRLAQEYFARRRDVVMTPLNAFIYGNATTSLMLLSAVVGLVLLVATANVASLLLARVLARERAFAIRRALGASRTALARLVIFDALVLSLLGAAFGVWLAWISRGALVALAPAGLPGVGDVETSGASIVFTLGAALLTATLVSLAPMIRLSDVQLRSRSFSARTSGFLAIGEISAAASLLVAAGLIVQSFWNLQDTELGFRPEGVVSFHLSPTRYRYPDDAQQRAYYRAMLERLREVRGALHVGAVRVPPFKLGTIGQDSFIRIEGRSEAEQQDNPIVNYEIATPGYFRAMGIRLLEGRTFQDDESLPVAILSRSLADRMWPGKSPLDKRIQLLDSDAWLTVVGVVEEVRYRELQRARLDVYPHYLQTRGVPGGLNFAMRSEREPMALLSDIAAAVHSVDEAQPLDNFHTMESVVARELAPWRFNAWMVGVFAALATVLAAIGIFALLARSVVERSREIAVRMALGAARADVIRSVVARAAQWTSAGLALGFAAAVIGSRLVTSLLFEVSATNPWFFGFVFACIAAVALGASVVPAWRAARLDPIELLRAD